MSMDGRQQAQPAVATDGKRAPSNPPLSLTACGSSRGPAHTHSQQSRRPLV